MTTIRFGQIVVVSTMLDPNGVNPKDRPAVVLTANHSIVPGGPIDVAAVSTLLPGGLPRAHVALPWHPRGHPRTGLRTRCAAVCSWIETIDEPRILRVIGTVPGQVMGAITAAVLAFGKPGPAKPTTP